MGTSRDVILKPRPSGPVRDENSEEERGSLMIVSAFILEAQAPLFPLKLQLLRLKFPSSWCGSSGSDVGLWATGSSKRLRHGVV